MGWNTETLITEASKGAVSSGAQVERFDLFRLERYTGCISCFGCKREKNKGICVCRDGLTPVLDAVRSSGGLIVGSPNYLGELLIWLGVLVSGVTALRGVWQWVLSILGFVLIVWVMFSGARRLEIRQDKNYGDDPEYQEYVRTVPIIIPFIPLYSVKKYKFLMA